MPYKIRKSGSGYKVYKKEGGKCFSNKALPKARAQAQMKAIYANESRNKVINVVLEKLMRLSK